MDKHLLRRVRLILSGLSKTEVTAVQSGFADMDVWIQLTSTKDNAKTVVLEMP